ncbi:DNA adenine methylase [Dysgonomonas capnocytophagoides]|uniref:DNA adenine methylase n=1 Tax=Dysgonomonas capnocytophagoides TaxID=45254 RepID=UPI00333FCA0A
MKKMYKNAPLPFQGQKRRFIGAFGLALEQLKNKQDIKIIIDLFGGSGLLSHTAKQMFPQCDVIYNDFDNYSGRLKNIKQTNILLSKVRHLVKDCLKDKKIESDIRQSILDLIKETEQYVYVDYITLSASLLFSGKYALNYEELEKQSFYNCVKATDYDEDIISYLDGIDIQSCDYRELYEKYKNVQGVLFLVDPPYLSTDCSTYKSDKYWKLRDYLDVLNVLVDSNYVFFTSNKSSLIELCEWFDENRNIGNPFKNSVLNTQNITINKTSSGTSGYTDMMLYKFVK